MAKKAKGESMNTSRRDFLKLGGMALVTAGAAGMTACSPNSDNGNISEVEGRVVGYGEIDWVDEADVVIVGTGITGLSAAIAPVKAGKKVVVLEKLSTYGGESGMSCGFFFHVGTNYLKERGMDMSTDEGWEKCRDTVLSMAEASGKTESWYEDWFKGMYYAGTEWADIVTDEFGAKWQEPMDIGGFTDDLGTAYSTIMLPENGVGFPTSVLNPIYDSLKELGVDFQFDTRALNLIVDESGKIVGIRCRNENTGVNKDFKSKCVCLATGGFACNQEMVSAYLPSVSQIGCLTNYSNGEGQQMGVAAGAKAHRMDAYAYLMGDIAQGTTWGYFSPVVMVTPDGRRFIREDQSHDCGEACIAAGFNEWWVIFDEVAADTPQIASSIKVMTEGNPDRAFTAETVEELAEMMNVPVANLAETISKHNADAEKGIDEEFGKQGFLMALKAPFHAIKLNVRRYKTFGGFLTSAKSEVLNDADEPIVGLYAAGSTVPWTQSNLMPNAGDGYRCGKCMVEFVDSVA